MTIFEHFCISSGSNEGRYCSMPRKKILSDINSQIKKTNGLTNRENEVCSRKSLKSARKNESQFKRKKCEQNYW